MDDLIYGARCRIGLIYPAPGWVMEPEFYLMSPPGVATLATRITLEACNIDGVSRIGERAVEAAGILTQAPVDVIALGCTSGSFINGVGYDRELIDNMKKASNGVPCTTTSSASVAALNALGVKKIAVATPYIEEINERARRFLVESGFTVTNLRGLGLLTDADIDRQDLETVYRLVRDADTKDAEAVFIACTGLRSVPVLQALENDLGKPVVSAIQATFWSCLRMAGVKERISGFGRLLER